MAHDEEKYNRQNWMTEDHWECAKFLHDYFYGWHHMDSERIKQCGNGIDYNESAARCRFATFDFDGLTRAVVMAHERCIRFEICGSGPSLLKLRLHKRHKREGCMYERHPDIDDAISKLRASPNVPKQEILK